MHLVWKNDDLKNGKKKNMPLEDQFKIIRKILEEVTRENKDIITNDEYQLIIVELARDLLFPITSSDLRENIIHLSHIRHSAGSLDNAIQKLKKKIKKNHTH